MDDVEITDEGGYHVEIEPPKNQDLSSLSLTVGELLAQHGWYLLLASVLGFLLIQYLSKRRSSQSSHSSTPATQDDSVFVARRQEAMEAARRNMQMELDAKAALFKEKQKQQEEEKRRQKIEIWESMQQGKSYNAKRSQTTEEASSSTTVLKSKSDKKPLRSAGYNPLSGDGGGSCSWRPGRRGPSSGG